MIEFGLSGLLHCALILTEINTWNFRASVKNDRYRYCSRRESISAQEARPACRSLNHEAIRPCGAKPGSVPARTQ